jgi:polyhydroxyalkanoate synthesis regulator phasin
LSLFQEQARKLRVYEKSFEKMKIFISKLDSRLVNRDAEIERLNDLIKDLKDKRGK